MIINSIMVGDGGGINANVNIASAYNSSSTYKVGDLVIYDTGLYECIAEITSPEEWNAAHWTQTIVADVLADKADIDGYYEEMSVGNAEQLISSVKINDKTPYNFRTSGGSNGIGNRKNEKIVGGTVAWNQLIPNGNFESLGNWGTSGTAPSTLSVANNTLTVSATGTWTTSGSIRQTRLPDKLFKSGHVLFATAKVSPSKAFKMRFNYSAISDGVKEQSVSANVWTTIGNIIKMKTDDKYPYLYISADPQNLLVSGDTVSVQNFMYVDLTQMFGSTIADYIYSLEQANAGAGVAWFKSLFPKDYYPYNAGELMSVKTSKAVMTGFNAYNHTSGVAEVIAGLPYQITGTYTALSLEGESVTPDANGLFTPSKTGALTVTGGDSSSTCVHLVWDGERNGEYEEYTEHVYPLDSSLTLRGIPKLDASNKLYYDGDTYESDGTVTRRYGIVDLGTLNWTWNASNGWNAPMASVGNVKPMANNNSPMSGISDKYRVVSKEESTQLVGSASEELTIASTWQGTYIYCTNQNVTPSGYLVYELATPTEETADPYTDPMIVNDWGTEKFVDTRTVAIPVGHDTFYLANLKAKLEMAPNSPDGDGDYIVRQSGGVNSYVAIGGLVDRIPEAPSSDGTYVLKATVSGATKTYSWIAE